DRLRSEARFPAAGGGSTVVGSVIDGGAPKLYASPGAGEADLRVPLVMPAVRPAGTPDGADPGAADVKVVRFEPGPSPEQGEQAAGVSGQRSDGNREVTFSLRCPPPQRKGEATVAGRAVHVIE